MTHLAAYENLKINLKLSEIYRDNDRKCVNNKNIKYKQTAISNYIKTPYKRLRNINPIYFYVKTGS